MKIIRRFILILCLLLPALSSQAAKRTRVVEIDTVFQASQAYTQQTIDACIYGVQTDIYSLFSWAFKDTGTQNKGKKEAGKGKDAITIEYTGNTYDPQTRTGVLSLNVYVLGVKWGNELQLITKSKTYTSKGVEVTRLDFDYTGSAIKSAYLEFRISPLSAGQTRVESTFSITFGRFFSVFISDSVWREVIEWRVRRFYANLAEYAAMGEDNPYLLK